MLAYHLSLFLVFIIAQNIIYYSLTCNGANDKDCVTCNASAHRYEDFGPHDKKCLCSDGYYDDDSNEECAACDSTW